MPFTACLNSFWFGLYDCHKMAILGPRMGIFFSFSFSRQFSVHDFSETIGPRLTKFGMWLRYDKMHAGIFWIFEFPIFMRFLAFLKKNNFVHFSVHDISEPIGTMLKKFGMWLRYDKMHAGIFWIFEFPIFMRFLAFLKKNNFVHFSVHDISEPIGTRLTKFGMWLCYGKIHADIFWIFEFPIFMRFLALFQKNNFVYFSVDDISEPIGPRVTKFVCGFVMTKCMPIFFGFFKLKFLSLK